MDRVIFITLPNGYFGSAGASWKSLDLGVLSQQFFDNDFEVHALSIDSALAYDFKDSDFVIYTSSDEPSVRAYIKDVMFFLNGKAKIIPPYEALLAHENKGFQQIHREYNKFGNLPGLYHFDIDAVSQDYPYVFKLIGGAGGKSVSLVDGPGNLKSIRKKFFKLSFVRRLIKLVRWVKLTKKQYEIYDYRHKGFFPFVTQKFVEGLDSDYKVLVFGEKYFVLKRGVRKNDFRASGSGNFSYEVVPEAVLNFSEEIFLKLNSPYASLDVAFDGVSCFLIEYQLLNFGPYTLVNSPGFYQRQGTSWSLTHAKSELEKEFSCALLAHVLKIKRCSEKVYD